MKDIFSLLVSKNFISQEQNTAIDEYQKRGLFSVRNELLFLVYISILLFTTGIGIVIYDNIDTIGHSVLLILLAIVTVVCFYFCYKKAKGFSKQEVVFDNPLYDYLVLFTAILTCTLIGYFQYNLNIQNSNYSLATLISGIVTLVMAYYFDNKSVLVIAITALASFVGLSLNANSIFENDIFEDNRLIVAGLFFGVFLLVWQLFSERKAIKIHFSFVILTFALHLLALSCFAGVFQDSYWALYLLILGSVVYYFYKKSIEYKAISWYVFTLFYGYIGSNILIFRVLDIIEFHELFDLLTILTPFYVIGSIVLFIKMVKNFKKKTNDSE
jgi:hypothetical protein